MKYHLADVFIAGLQNNKLSSTNLIKWFNSFNFNPESSSQIEFHRFGNLKSFAEDIYVKLNTDNLLNNKLANLEEKIQKEQISLVQLQEKLNLKYTEKTRINEKYKFK